MTLRENCDFRQVQECRIFKTSWHIMNLQIV